MIDLHLEERRDGERLLLDYRVDNLAKGAVFASVRSVLRGKPSRRPYTFLPFDALVLRATFRTPPSPPGTSYFFGTPAVCGRIPPRSSLSGWAEIDLPVKELQPFSDPPYPEHPARIAVRELDFEFEWVLESEAVRVSQMDEEGELFVALGPPGYASARLMLSEPIEVLRRPGLYYRF